MAPTIEQNPLLTERDAAKYLAISDYLLQIWRWKHVGPRWIRVGGPNGRAIRYRLSDLEQYLCQNTVETADTARRPL